MNDDVDLGSNFSFYISDDFGFEFAKPQFYFYLNQTGVYTVDGTNDAKDYNDLRVIAVNQYRVTTKYGHQMHRFKFLLYSLRAEVSF